jgi:hypothetical protein
MKKLTGIKCYSLFNLKDKVADFSKSVVVDIFQEKRLD